MLLASADRWRTAASPPDLLRRTALWQEPDRPLDRLDRHTLGGSAVLYWLAEPGQAMRVTFVKFVTFGCAFSGLLPLATAGSDYHRVVCQTGESDTFRPFLDELGYLPIDKRGADLLFQVVAARYEVGSIVITTNRPFREWGKLFDVDNTLAAALIDRLMHHGEGIMIQGENYRMKNKYSDSTDE
jgi:IstB-like ATP binding protein